MRVHIYPEQAKSRLVLIVPGRRAHLAPLVLQGPVGDHFDEELRVAIALVDETERQALQPPLPF